MSLERMSGLESFPAYLTGETAGLNMSGFDVTLHVGDVFGAGGTNGAGELVVVVTNQIR